MLAACRGAIEYFAGLAQGPPLAGWASLPIPKPIGWDELSGEERQFLQEAVPVAATRPQTGSARSPSAR